jgi:Na+-transporting NADH:ubiquinone oxidoreductase subunit D
VSIIDGLGNGIGYSVVLIFVALFCEFFGSGSLFGQQLLPLATEGGWYTPNGLLVLSPGAFFLIAIFIWIVRSFKPDQIEED